MPVFGKSLFETVLDGLEDQDAEEDAAAPSPVRGLNGGFVAALFDAPDEAPTDPALRFSRFDPDPVPVVPEIPAWAGRLAETDVAADLALAGCRTGDALRERRRIFALANHPDRVPVEYRRQATTRMMIANRMVDEALARLG